MVLGVQVFRFAGLGFAGWVRCLGLRGLRISLSGFWVRCFGFRVWGLCVLGVWGSGFRVWVFGGMFRSFLRLSVEGRGE